MKRTATTAASCSETERTRDTARRLSLIGGKLKVLISTWLPILQQRECIRHREAHTEYAQLHDPQARLSQHCERKGKVRPTARVILHGTVRPQRDASIEQ